MAKPGDCQRLPTTASDSIFVIHNSRMNSAAGALIAHQAKLIQDRNESNAKKLFREKVMCKQKWRFFIRICSGEK